MPDAIKVDAIPGAEINPDAIEDNARTISTISGQVAEHGSNVHFTWQRMAGVYEAPESPTLLGLMAPVSSQATQVSDNLAEVSAALTAFAADVRPIKAELDSLRVQAQNFIDSIQGGVRIREVNPAWTAAQTSYGATTAAPMYQGAWGSSTTGASSATPPQKYRYVTKQWHESQEHVDRNNELIAAVNAQQVKLWEAERACANRIRALYGAAPLHAATSDGDALGYGITEIPEGTDMPWGAEAKRTEDCAEGTVRFVFKDFLWEGIIVGGIGGTLSGLGSLVVGFDPATWTFFSTDAWGAAWSGLGTLAAGALMNSTPPLNLLLMADDVAQNFGGQLVPQEVRDFKDTTDRAWQNTGKALIAWDKWQDDPGTALGESVFNVATILIPAGAAVAGVKTAAGAASAVSKMAKVVDFVDPAAYAMNGAMKLGGAGIKGLDGIIGRLGTDTTDGFHLHTPDMPFVADDPASAMRALDNAGVDLNSITARIDDGIPVYEFPPTDALPSGRIEMPAGAFDAARTVDIPVHTDGGAVDAGIAAPLREPELVTTGSIRGETSPAPVNSIIDDSPTRTETRGTAESTIVREPSSGNSNDSGLGRGEEADGHGHGGDNAPGAGHTDDGARPGDEGVNSAASELGLGNHAHPDADAQAPAADGPESGAADPHSAAPADSPSSAALPRHEGPMYSADPSGLGWVRAQDTGTLDPIYGDIRPDSGTPQPWYSSHTVDDPEVHDIVTDPAAPWGRDANGTPITDQSEWNSRYTYPDHSDGSIGGVRWPANDGAAPGTRVHYDDTTALLRDYPEFSRIDRIGLWIGDYLTIEGTPFEMRGLTPGHRSMDYFAFDLTNRLPKGVKIEISVIGRAFGYPGGGWQIRFFRSLPSGPEYISVDDLIDLGVLG